MDGAGGIHAGNRRMRARWTAGIPSTQESTQTQREQTESRDASKWDEQRRAFMKAKLHMRPARMECSEDA